MEKSTDRLTGDQQEEIAALEQLPDDQIDTNEVPEIPDWSTAKRGALYRPVKQQITLRHWPVWLIERCAASRR